MQFRYTHKHIILILQWPYCTSIYIGWVLPQYCMREHLYCKWTFSSLSQRKRPSCGVRLTIPFLSNRLCWKLRHWSSWSHRRLQWLPYQRTFTSSPRKKWQELAISLWCVLWITHPKVLQVSAVSKSIACVISLCNRLYNKYIHTYIAGICICSVEVNVH